MSGLGRGRWRVLWLTATVVAAAAVGIIAGGEDPAYAGTLLVGAAALTGLVLLLWPGPPEQHREGRGNDFAES